VRRAPGGPLAGAAVHGRRGGRDAPAARARAHHRGEARVRGLRIEGWLRALPEALSHELRPQWSRLRELGKDEITLDAIERLVALERLRGSRGA